jgi:hypothetical protein
MINIVCKALQVSNSELVELGSKYYINQVLSPAVMHVDCYKLIIEPILCGSIITVEETQPTIS